MKKEVEVQQIKTLVLNFASLVTASRRGMLNIDYLNLKG